jgi:surface antigen
VAALGPTVQSRRLVYRGMPFRRHAVAGRFAAGACCVVLALGLGGCSFSYQLDNLFAKRDEEKSDQTASLRSRRPKSATDALAQVDWVFARAAVTEVLDKGGNHVSAPWENPGTGARGTVTPLASAYTREGTTCRDFLASYVKNGSESWLEGSACRAGRGNWEVRDLRPRKNT